MPDVGEHIPALVTLLIAIGSGVGWWLRRRDGRKDPIPKESAAVALAESSVAIMKGVADELRADLATERQIRTQDKAQHAAELRALRAEMQALQTRQKSTEDQLADTRTDIDWLRTTLGVAASYIENLLRWARADSRPPIPPLPEKLRTLIDPSLHTLDEET